jgi:hypothetical protein
VHTAVLASTLAVLAEGGYAALTIESATRPEGKDLDF